MKKYLIVLSLLCLIFFIFSEEKKDPFYDDYGLLKEFYSPRDEGTLNERRLLKYIENFCSYYGVEYKRKKIDNEKDIITNSYNLEVYLKGSSTGKEQLVIVCPLNTMIMNQIDYDNSLTIKIVLDLIKQCNNIPFEKDLIFLFSGANEGEKPLFNGIKYYLETGENLNKSFVTIIDILSNKSKIRFSGSSNKMPIPLQILKQFLKMNKNEGDFYFNRYEIYKSRFFLKSSNNYVSQFLNEDVMAVSYSNRDHITASAYVNDMEYQKKLTTFFVDWLIFLDSIQLPIDADHHYHYLNIFGLNIFFRELFQVIFFLILIFFIIFIRLFFPKFQRLHLDLFFKILPYFIVIFIVQYIASFIPLILFFPIDLFTGLTKPYLNIAVLYVFNIFFIPLMMLFILFEFIEKLPFPKRSYLYIYGAIVFSSVNLFIFAVLDISIAYIYLWAIFSLTASQFTSKRSKLKYILYIVSCIPFILLIFDLTLFGDTNVIKGINIFLLNFLFSVLVFPFSLLLLRGYIIYRSVYKEIIKKNFFVYGGLIILISIIGFILISIATFPEDKVVEAKLETNVKEAKSKLFLNSNMIIGKIFIQDEKGDYNYTFNRKDKMITTEVQETFYEIKEISDKESAYNYTLLINSKYFMEYVKIYLISPIGNYPMESNYVFNKIENFEGNYDPISQDVYQFIVGRNPGKKLLFNMAVNKGIYRLYLKIEYPLIKESALLISKNDGIVNKRSVFIEDIEFKND